MNDRRLRRGCRALLLGGAALALLSGCEAGEFGYGGRGAEWARSVGAFSVVSATPGRAVVSANGQQVAVEPPPGFCLSDDSVETSDRSAFVLIGDCVLDGPPGGVPGIGGQDAPGMPGMMTVSISGGSGLPDEAGGDLSALEAYLSSPEGRTLLGRGGDGAQVSLVETRRSGGILYVLVEDSSAEAAGFLAPRFWRAFVELNGRLAVVTLSGFSDVPMPEDEMLRHVSQQVRQLQVANAVPPDEAPVQIAAARRGARPVEAGSGDEPEIAAVEADLQGAAGAAGTTPRTWAALAAAEPALAASSADNGIGPAQADGAFGEGPLTAAQDGMADAGPDATADSTFARAGAEPTTGDTTRLMAAAADQGASEEPTVQGAAVTDPWADQLASGGGGIGGSGGLLELRAASDAVESGAQAIASPDKAADLMTVPATRTSLAVAPDMLARNDPLVRNSGREVPGGVGILETGLAGGSEADEGRDRPLVAASAPAHQVSTPVPARRPDRSGARASGAGVRLPEPQPRQGAVLPGDDVPVPMPRLATLGSRSSGVPAAALDVPVPQPRARR